MPAPETYEYSLDAKIVAHEAFRDLLDAQNVSESGTASMLVYDAADTLLATIPLAEPCGEVSEEDGRFTFLPDGRDESAAESGTPAYVVVVDAAGNPHLAVPAQVSSSPVAGAAVFNASLVQGAPVELVSATIG